MNVRNGPNLQSYLFPAYISLNGTSTNAGPTNVGCEQRSDSKNVGLTNLGLVHTSHWYKRRAGTNVALVKTSDPHTSDGAKFGQ